MAKEKDSKRFAMRNLKIPIIIGAVLAAMLYSIV